MLTDDATRHAGFALMTVLQETTYIAGPLVAGVAIALGSAADAVAASAALSFVGALVFATGLEPSPVEPRKPRSGRLPALAGAGIRTVVATAAAFGITFGILDVVFPAFAHARGAAAVSGVLLSAFAAGSWVGGFAYGLRPRGSSPGRRFPRLCLLAGLGLAPLIAAVNLPVMVVLAAISGLCFAPITTTQIAVVDDVAEPEHTAEAFTWLGTMYGTGLAVGAALSGQLITAVGIRLALAVACGATLLAWVVATLRAKTLTRASDEAETGRQQLAAR
jgi:MFS family permease